jgi:predicted enzyme related to lactoylglutathione lyase
MFDLMSAALAGNIINRQRFKAPNEGCETMREGRRSRDMDVMGIYAAACVSDMERSVDWYSRLMGREPDDRPMPTLVQWRNPGAGGVQLFLDAERAGRSLITIVTPLMDKARAGLEAAGVVLGPDVRGDWGIIAQVNDPDGNRITLAEPPKVFAG